MMSDSTGQISGKEWQERVGVGWEWDWGGGSLGCSELVKFGCVWLVPLKLAFGS